MRAEEGDETVKDYAAEGRQTLSRLKGFQQGRLGGVARRFAKLWRGEHGAADGGAPK